MSSYHVYYHYRVTVIKMSQMAYCFVFYADGAKTLVTVRAKYFSAPERFY